MLRRPDGRALPALRGVARHRPASGAGGVAHQPAEHRGRPRDRAGAHPRPGHAGCGRRPPRSRSSRTTSPGRRSAQRSSRCGPGSARPARRSARPTPCCGSSMDSPSLSRAITGRRRRSDAGRAGAGDLGAGHGPGARTRARAGGEPAPPGVPRARARGPLARQAARDLHRVARADPPPAVPLRPAARGSTR